MGKHKQGRCRICGRFVKTKPYSMNICPRHGLPTIGIPLEAEATKQDDTEGKDDATTKRD